MAVGEIQVGDLPTMTAVDFTANDYIFMIDNGKFAKKISRPDFFSVVQALVKGDKGDVGATGATGERGLQGERGERGLKGDVGATGSNGVQGIQGLAGNNGWSPVLASTTDGDRRVMFISNWVGGTGEAPSTGQYIGGTGLVSDISLAVDFRGVQGLQGLKGDKGDTGANGVNAKQITTLSVLTDGKVEITYSDATKTTSNTPSNTLGWASYKDALYTSSNKLTVAPNTTVVLPNNAGVTIQTSLPVGVSSLYNQSTQKILVSDNYSMFGVRLRFKVVNSGSVAEFINISLDKSTTDVPFSDDKIIRTDTNPQTIDVSTQIYSDAVTLANGLTARIKTASQSIQVYDVEFVISKLT